MRLSKTFWLILGIGISVIVVGVLGWSYLDQRGEQKTLNESLSGAQTTLPMLVSQRDDLESQLTQRKSELAQAESLLGEAKASFPESVESIEYGERLFKIAKSCKLEITMPRVTELRGEKVEGITYARTQFEVVVKGKVADILGFINTIATDKDFANATIESVTMNFEGGKPSATIKLVIYGYQGE